MNTTWRDFVKSAGFISQDGKNARFPMGKSPWNMRKEYKSRFGQDFDINAFLRANNIKDPKSIREGVDYLLTPPGSEPVNTNASPVQSSSATTNSVLRGAFSPDFIKFLEAAIKASKISGMTNAVAPRKAK